MLSGVVLVALSPAAAQVPLDATAMALRSHLGLEALDRYLETWNKAAAGPVTARRCPLMRPSFS